MDDTVIAEFSEALDKEADEWLAAMRDALADEDINEDQLTGEET